MSPHKRSLVQVSGGTQGMGLTFSGIALPIFVQIEAQRVTYKHYVHTLCIYVYTLLVVHTPHNVTKDRWVSHEEQM